MLSVILIVLEVRSCAARVISDTSLEFLLSLFSCRVIAAHSELDVRLVADLPPTSRARRLQKRNGTGRAEP